MDITQDVSLKATRRCPVPGRQPLFDLIYRVCVNANLDHLRKKQKQPATPWTSPGH